MSDRNKVSTTVSRVTMDDDPVVVPRPDALPCPFCGEQPTIQYWHGGPTSRRMVSCRNDECPAGPAVLGNTEAAALAKWNTRRG